MSEAVNDSPIFVTEKAVDRDGLAVWSHGRSAEERKAYCKPPWPSLRPTAHGNDAIVIMNASSGYRIFSFTVVVVQMRPYPTYLCGGDSRTDGCKAEKTATIPTLTPW